MKYHPDVNTTGKTHEPNADKFREIAEAYAVLSVPENKMSYDSGFVKKSEAVYASAKSEVMEMKRKMRDRSGRVPGPQPMRGSYAEHRIKHLEKERAKFNVNHLGYYNGGLPQKHKGGIRGSALGQPGEPHNSHIHNRMVRNEREAFEVDLEGATEFRGYQNLDRDIRTRARPYRTLITDPDWTYVKNRTYATFILLGILGY